MAHASICGIQACLPACICTRLQPRPLPCITHRKMKFDDLLRDHVGDCGRYQAFVVIILCMIGIPEAMFLLDIVFTAGRPDFWCAIPKPKGALENITHDVWLNHTVPWEDRDGEWRRSRCSYYNRSFSESVNILENLEPENVTNGLEDVPLAECSSFEYDQSVFISTIVTEWDLVCWRDYLVSMTKAIMMAGAMTGVAVGGVCADRFGRRRVIFVCLVLTPLFRLLEIFSNSLELFIASRFLTSVSNGAMYIVAFTLAVEFVGARRRALVGTLIAEMYAVGYMITALGAYLIRERWLFQLALTVPYTLFFSLFCILQESPRWLYARGRHEEADAIMQKIARRNGTRFPVGVRVTLDDDNRAPIWQLFSTRRLFIQSTIVIYAWFVCAVSYFGLTLNIGSLAGNIYLNLFLTAIFEILAYIASQVAMGTRLGRRYTTCGSFLLSGASLLCILALPTDQAIARTALSTFGRFCISGAYNAIYIWTAEVFPTVVRNSAMSTASTLGKIGGVLAPLTERLEPIWKPMPTVIFGAMALVGGVLLLVLPETKGRPLPQTIGDMTSTTSDSTSMEVTESLSPKVV